MCESEKQGIEEVASPARDEKSWGGQMGDLFDSEELLSRGKGRSMSQERSGRASNTRVSKSRIPD